MEREALDQIINDISRSPWAASSGLNGEELAVKRGEYPYGSQELVISAWWVARKLPSQPQ